MCFHTLALSFHFKDTEKNTATDKTLFFQSLTHVTGDIDHTANINILTYNYLNYKQNK